MSSLFLVKPLQNEEEENTNLLSLVSLKNSKSYTIDTYTNLRSKRCVGSSHGWLGFVDNGNSSSNPFLLDPFTKTLINLPSFSPPSNPRSGTIDKLILSTNPHSRNCKNYVVVVMYTYLLDTKLAFYVQGDEHWIDQKGKLEAYYDIICRDDTLLALGPGPEIEAWDLNKRTLTRTIRLQDSCPGLAEDRKRFESDLYCSQWYLALSPSSRHMFVVMRYKGEFVRYDGEVVREGDTLTDYCSEPLVCPYRTVWFHVYKVDHRIIDYCNNTKGFLMEEATESDLNGFALFVGGNESVMVSSNGELKGNRIYFTDDYWEQVDVDYCYGGHDMGIFDLRDGRFEDAMEDQQQRIVPPPFWITKSDNMI